MWTFVKHCVSNTEHVSEAYANNLLVTAVRIHLICIRHPPGSAALPCFLLGLLELAPLTTMDLEQADLRHLSCRGRRGEHDKEEGHGWKSCIVIRASPGRSG